MACGGIMVYVQPTKFVKKKSMAKGFHTGRVWACQARGTGDRVCVMGQGVDILPETPADEFIII